jgi:hypothetical protein
MDSGGLAHEIVINGRLVEQEELRVHREPVGETGGVSSPVKAVQCDGRPAACDVGEYHYSWREFHPRRWNRFPGVPSMTSRAPQPTG